MAVLLFPLLSPGVLFQLPANDRVVQFVNFKTNGFAIIIHAVIYFALLTIFIIAFDVHIYTG